MTKTILPAPNDTEVFNAWLEAANKFVSQDQSSALAFARASIWACSHLQRPGFDLYSKSQCLRGLSMAAGNAEKFIARTGLMPGVKDVAEKVLLGEFYGQADISLQLMTLNIVEACRNYRQQQAISANALADKVRMRLETRRQELGLKLFPYG